MSVIVKGMKMPKRCSDCELEEHDEYELTHECRLIYKGYTNNFRMFERHKNCPLVELPEHHGELIDRQKLLEDNKHLEYPTDGKYRRDRAWSVGFNAGAKHCNEHAVYAKTVIEAEGVEE